MTDLHASIALSIYDEAFAQETAVFADFVSQATTYKVSTTRQTLAKHTAGTNAFLYIQAKQADATHATYRAAEFLQIHSQLCQQNSRSAPLTLV